MPENLLPPYKYSREDFYKLLDEFRSGGPCSSQKYNGKIDWQTVRHLDRVEYMSYGVGRWLYQKAIDGCEESLFKIDYHYDLYDEVVSKAKEENNYE